MKTDPADALSAVRAAIHTAAEQLRAMPDDELVALAMAASASGGGPGMGLVERATKPAVMQRDLKPARKSKKQEAAKSSPGPTRAKSPLDPSLLALLAKGPAKLEDLVAVVKGNTSTVRSALFRLQRKGLVQKSSRKHNTPWSLA